MCFCICTFVVNELEKYLDPEFVDDLLSVTAKTDAIIAGKLLSFCFVYILTIVFMVIFSINGYILSIMNNITNVCLGTHFPLMSCFLFYSER